MVGMVGSGGDDIYLPPARSHSALLFESQQYLHRRPQNSRHLNKQGVVKIATLINALVDMDYFTEEEEQELFEHAVMLVLDKIEEILPSPIMRLVLETDFEDGVDDEMANTMRDRLLEYVKRNVSLPYLDSTDEAPVPTRRG